jgi:precorrin-2 dehydrogenase/sirohydrochlorin ferrochelatase
MRYYPVCLDLRNRNCLVVGGGSVGTRKVATLLDCGAKVTVVSPEATPRLTFLADNHSILWIRRSFKSSDLDRIFLVIGATNDESLNLQISHEAEKNNILCNIADHPAACNFILPSVISRGDLCIAVSTSGKSPAYAKKLRHDLEDKFGSEHADFLHLMGALRKLLLEQEHTPEEHKPIFEKLIHSNIIALIKDRDEEGIDALLNDILGPGYKYDALMRADNPI